VSELVRRTETFIVRMWAEYLDQTPPIWRGEIEHVGSGKVTRFKDLSEIDGHIQRCVLPQQKSSEKEIEK
jgi:hypothetical protein